MITKYKRQKPAEFDTMTIITWDGSFDGAHEILKRMGGGSVFVGSKGDPTAIEIGLFAMPPNRVMVYLNDTLLDYSGDMPSLDEWDEVTPSEDGQE